MNRQPFLDLPKHVRSLQPGQYRRSDRREFRHKITGRRYKRTNSHQSTASADASGHAETDLHPDIVSVVYTSEQIRAAVQRLGRDLAIEYADSEPLILGALTGAFIFMADLTRSIEPLPQGTDIDFFSASSYGYRGTSSGTVALTLGTKLRVDGRAVLVVDDIIDTGKTLVNVVAALYGKGAASVKTCVLLDKAERRTNDMHPDFTALKCPNEFVVGYGLDFKEKYRSLPYIGVIKPQIYE